MDENKCNESDQLRSNDNNMYFSFQKKKKTHSYVMMDGVFRKVQT